MHSMKGWDPLGETGPRKPLPDSVTIMEPREDKIVTEPSSEQREPAIPVAVPAEDAFAAPDPTYQLDAFAQQPEF